MALEARQRRQVPPSFNRCSFFTTNPPFVNLLCLLAHIGPFQPRCQCPLQYPGRYLPILKESRKRSSPQTKGITSASELEMLSSA